MQGRTGHLSGEYYEHSLIDEIVNLLKVVEQTRL